MEKFHILLDARKIADGGIGTYLRNLIRGFTRHDALRVSLLGNPDSICKYDLPRGFEVIPDFTKPYSIKELFFLSKKINRISPDVFHTPHYMLPYSINCASVVTVHDLVHIHYPQAFYYPYISSFFISSVLKRATQIITVSETSRRELLNFGVRRRLKEREIYVIPNAVEPLFFEETSINEKRQNFFLSIISTEKPHKGLQDLILAFAKFRKLTGAGSRLILAGQGIQTLDIVNDSIEVRGVVSSSELSLLYQSANALVVPSLDEGFCIPVLEAHACGCPVIARPIDSVKEILTAEDFVASDMTVDALSQAMARFSEFSSPNRQALRMQASRYTFERCTNETLEIYEKARKLFEAEHVF